MADIKISDMMRMQMNLWEQHKDTWSPWKQNSEEFYTVDDGRNGRMYCYYQEKGDSAIMGKPLSEAFLSREMSDVLMYIFDTLLRYGVTPEEISNAGVAKHQ